MHASFFESLMVVLEVCTPCIKGKINVELILFITGFTLLKLTGGLSWYIKLIDDYENRDKQGGCYKQMKRMHMKRKELVQMFNYLERDTRSKRGLKIITSTSTTATVPTQLESAPPSPEVPISPSFAQNGWRRQKLRHLNRNASISKWFKKHNLTRFLVDTVAFYLIYLSCDTAVSTYMMKPMIEVSKMDVYNALPSSQLNITHGYHPSIINRFLSESLKLVGQDEEEKFHVAEELAKILEDTVYSKGDRTCTGNNVVIYHDDNNNNNNEDQSIEEHEKSRLDADEQKCHAINILPHLIELRRLEEKWATEDDEFMLNAISSLSYGEFFGNYDAVFWKPGSYFLFYFTLFVVSLISLSKVGVSANSIF